VKEELKGVGSTTAVGRTTAVTADLQYDGQAITAVNVTADLRQLASDNIMRDGQLRQQALETDRYSTAKFTLTKPIAIDSAPVDGQTMSVTAVGDLSLHGVTRQVSVPLQGQFINGQLVVVGSMDIAFADFGITPPNSFSVLSVENHGVMELQLLFQKADV
jgi:polyisoprenoid-binding protein YceI